MSGGVLVIAQQRGGELERGALETLAFAQRLAGELGSPVTALLLGHQLDLAAQALRRTAVERVLVADHAALAQYTPGAYLDALQSAVASARPAFVVFAHTYQTNDHMARLAQRLGAALVPEVLAFHRDGSELHFTRPFLQGKLRGVVRVRGAAMVVLSVQAGSATSDQVQQRDGPSAPVEPVELVRPPRPDRVLERIESAGSGGQVDLASAAAIVAVGRGVGDPEKLAPIRELAQALGAEIGASRPVVDSGWLPRELQIGSSGHTVSPRLYLALGISGAIQHLVGMKGAGCIVAVNKDASAPIFTVARYGWVGDLHEFVPALTAALLKRQSA